MNRQWLSLVMIILILAPMTAHRSVAAEAGETSSPPGEQEANAALLAAARQVREAHPELFDGAQGIDGGRLGVVIQEIPTQEKEDLLAELDRLNQQGVYAYYQADYQEALAVWKRDWPRQGLRRSGSGLVTFLLTSASRMTKIWTSTGRRSSILTRR